MEIYNDKQKEQLKQYPQEELLSPRSNANWGIKKLISAGVGLILAGLLLPFIINMSKVLSIVLVIVGLLIALFGFWLSKKYKSEIKNLH